MENSYNYQDVRRERPKFFQYTYEDMIKEVWYKASIPEEVRNTSLVSKLKLEISDLSKEMVECKDFNQKDKIMNRIIFLQNKVQRLSCS